MRLFLLLFILCFVVSCTGESGPEGEVLAELRPFAPLVMTGYGAALPPPFISQWDAIYASYFIKGDVIRSDIARKQWPPIPPLELEVPLIDDDAVNNLLTQAYARLDAGEKIESISPDSNRLRDICLEQLRSLERKASNSRGDELMIIRDKGVIAAFVASRCAKAIPPIGWLEDLVHDAILADPLAAAFAFKTLQDAGSLRFKNAADYPSFIKARERALSDLSQPLWASARWLLSSIQPVVAYPNNDSLGVSSAFGFYRNRGDANLYLAETMDHAKGTGNSKAPGNRQLLASLYVRYDPLDPFRFIAIGAPANTGLSDLLFALNLSTSVGYELPDKEAAIRYVNEALQQAIEYGVAQQVLQSVAALRKLGSLTETARGKALRFAEAYSSRLKDEVDTLSSGQDKDFLPDARIAVMLKRLLEDQLEREELFSLFSDTATLVINESRNDATSLLARIRLLEIIPMDRKDLARDLIGSISSKFDFASTGNDTLALTAGERLKVNAIALAALSPWKDESQARSLIEEIRAWMRALLPGYKEAWSLPRSFTSLPIIEEYSLVCGMFSADTPILVY